VRQTVDGRGRGGACRGRQPEGASRGVGWEGGVWFEQEREWGRLVMGKGGGGGVPVVAGSQQVDLRVGRQDPKAVVLPPEGLHPCALGHVPHPDALVLRVGDDDVLYESASGYLVKDLPHKNRWGTQ